MRRTRLCGVGLVAIAGLLGFSGAVAPSSDSDLAEHLLRKGGTTRGVVAILGTRGAEDVLAIGKAEGLRLLVQEPDARAGAAAREALDGMGALGTRAVVETAALDRLLLADDTADVVIAVSPGDGRAPKDLSVREILRVLRPGGKAIIGRRGDAGWRETMDPLVASARAAGASVQVSVDRLGAWVELAKPTPDGIDVWSHWEHGPDNNPVSTDRVIRAPYRTQWFGGPYYVAMPAITTAAGGRIFTAMGHIAHHEREEEWLNTLLARNAYNGTELWRRKLPDGYLVHRSAFIATGDLFYMIEGEGCLVLDAETGREVDRIRIPDLDGEWKYVAIQDGVLFALAGAERDPSETTIVRSSRTHWSWGELSDGYYTRRIPWGYGTTVAAYDLARKRALWRHEEDASIDSRALVIGGGKVFVYGLGSFVACIDAATGEPLWKNADPKAIALIEEVGRGLTSTPGFKTTAMALYTPEALVIQAQTHMNVVAFSPQDGRFLWSRKKVTSNPNAIYADGRVLVGIGPEGSTLVLDPTTGETIADLGFKKRSCARLTAAPDSFFCRGWPEGLTRYDREAKKVLFNGAFRPACNDGVIPAHGLLTMGPWLCDCNLQLMGTI
ncbi:MAG: PQQ-binding-like beta-propeller repeat protein, partial [Planctomycetes bacterium]|nr:PQQ-binding-like beta-propeller repeat protein [Planctomycetota bacterium]